MLQGHVEDSSRQHKIVMYMGLQVAVTCSTGFNTGLQYLTGVYIPRSTLQDSSLTRSMTHVIPLI